MPSYFQNIPGWFDFEDVYRAAADFLPQGGTVVEVGSWCGKSTCFLGELLRESGKDVRFYAVDSWVNWEFMDHVNPNHESVRPVFDYHMAQAGLSESILPIQAASVHAAQDFADGSCDFIFIDANHSYESLLQDLFSWFPKLRRGGIIAGHDHDRQPVEWAVNDFFEGAVRHRELRGQRCWWIDTSRFTDADYQNKKPGKLGGSRIFDCFLFYDELDLLEIRLRELEDVVDVFVISESPRTFKGAPKPFHFLDNLNRFERWIPQIRHVTTDPPITTPFTMERGDEWNPKAWANEAKQRNAVMNALDDCHKRDIIMVSDADEIPSAASVIQIPCDGEVRRLRHKGFHYNFNWWDERAYSYTMDTGCVIYHNFSQGCFVRNSDPQIEIPSGWHCTWFGGDSKIAQKKEWYNHPLHGERTHTPAAPRILQTDEPLSYMTDLSVLPAFVKENISRFAHLFDPRFVQSHTALFRGAKAARKP